MAALRPYFTETEMEDIEAAYFFCKYAHRGQEREDGHRYFDHPRAVAWLLFNELHIHDAEMIIMALLHDLVEDSFIMTEKRLEKNFGRTVALGVRNLSKNTVDDREYYWTRLLEVADWRELWVKLADRLHNLRTLDACNAEKQRRKLEETREHIYPLFRRTVTLTPKEDKFIYPLDHLCDQIRLIVDDE